MGSASSVTVIRRGATTTATRGAAQRGSALHLIAIGDDVLCRVPLPVPGAVTIGRGRDTDARIAHPSISRRHAVLHVAGDGTLTLEDLGSANGTQVRGERLAPGIRQPIRVGEVVDLGEVLVRVQRHTGGARLHRVWTHDLFEARLDEECLRAAHGATPTFTVLAVHAPEASPDAIAQLVRPIDIVGTYAADDYELVLVGAGDAEVDDLVHALRAGLGRRARIGAAGYGRDGRDASALIAASRGRLDTEGRPAPRVAAPTTTGAMHELRRLIERVAPTPISILLLGETGVGKEVLAEAVHRSSRRAAQPFVKLNCAAFSEQLLESELFGHEKGAFTGAAGVKPGLLETADGGTVFLDELGEMPLSIQAKLLRVLEDRAVLRVGGLRPRPIDVRFVAATNRDLDEEIARGRFRQDLYFRLNGIALVIPPLRERVDEIRGLATAFVAAAWAKLEHHPGPPPTISPSAHALLAQYPWPGNIRELRNVMERAAVLCTTGVITEQHLPADRMRARPVVARPPDAAPPELSADATRLPRPRVSGRSLSDSVRDTVEAEEKQRILAALDECAGNQTHAARLLGISRATLVNRLDLYAIKRPRKPPGGRSADRGPRR